MSEVKFYRVGGIVRDEMLGLPSKDIDYAVVADSYDQMKATLLQRGYEIFLETPQYLTIRARIPQTRETVDFTLCRKDGEYHDGRRPSEVTPGTIYDDLARRDFTINAMAQAEDGTLLDPHGGQQDLKDHVLKCVGSTHDRMKDDSLRSLRAIRFVITKQLTFCPELWTALNSDWLPPMIEQLSDERIRQELERAFAADTLRTMQILHELPREFRQAIFRNCWLRPTMANYKGKK